MPITSQSALCLSKTQSRCFGWAQSCQAKRAKTSCSNIPHNMWVNNTIHHRRAGSQTSLLSTWPCQGYKLTSANNAGTVKLFQTDADSLSEGALRWTRAEHRGHSPDWPSCCGLLLPGDAPWSTQSSRTVARTLSHTGASLKVVTNFQHLHFIRFRIWYKMFQIWMQAGAGGRGMLQAISQDPLGRNPGTHTTGLKLKQEPRHLSRAS